MNKKIMPFVLLLPLLAACEPKEDIIDPYADYHWSEADLALMEEHAYGVQIPYVEFQSYLLKYDEDYGLNGRLRLQGDRSTRNLYTKVVNAFVLAGWTSDTEFDIEEDTVFNFMIKVDIENDYRYLEGDVYTYNAVSKSIDYDGKGVLVIDVYDPFFYEWDAVEMNGLIGYLIGDEEVVLPNPNAHHYEMSNAYYEQYGFYTLVGYNDDETCVVNYVEKLVDNNFSVTTEVEGDTTFYECLNASESMALSIYYEPEINAMIINFASHLKTWTTWPSDEAIAKYLPAYLSDTIPAFTGEFSEVVVADQQGAFIAITVGSDTDVKNAAVSQYQADLIAAGYTEVGADSYGDMNYASPNKEINVVVYVTSKDYIMVEYWEYIEHNAWPYHSLECWLAYLGITDVSIPGAVVDPEESYVMVSATTGPTEEYICAYYEIRIFEDVKEAYKTSLENLGWVITANSSIGGYNGYDANKKVYVEIAQSEYASGITFITFYLYSDVAPYLY